jgi:hypothetical protein
MSVNQADLVHIYRALKLSKDIIEESPELVNDDEYSLFLVAWQVVDSTLKQEYKT